MGTPLLLAKYSVDIFCCFRPYLIRVVDIHSLDRRDGISERLATVLISMPEDRSRVAYVWRKSCMV